MENEIFYSIGGGEPSIPPIDTSIDPIANFYDYVNHKWQKSVHLPSYEDSFGVSEEIEMDVRNALLSAIEKTRRSHPEQPFSTLATSFLHTASQRNSILDLQRLLNTFDCIRGTEDVGEAIGRLNRIQSRAPISFVVNSDYYSSRKCCVYLYEAQVGMPSKYHYRDTSRILLKYSKLLAAVGESMNIEALESAIGTEASLLPYLAEGDDLQNVGAVYNPFKLKELEEHYKAIPWRAALRAWGLPEKDHDDVQYIVTNKKYFAALNHMFRTATLETWRTWMRALVVVSFLRYLPPPYDDLHYDLYDRALKGIAEKLPQKNLTLSVFMTYAPMDLSRMFVELEVEDGTKRSATNLIHRLKEATLHRLRAASWMDATTQRAALAKVEAMDFQVAFPETWISETESVTISASRPLQNIFALAGHDTERMIQDLIHHTCRKTATKWSDGAFEVNAYYYPEGNLMVVPAGILRPPFFDLRRSDAWNLGGIGAAIGHEITHGFDDDGRLFDKDGNYKNWWTPSDEKTYKKMARAIVDLFDGQSYMGGHVNGELTLSENLADLGGLAIALEALRQDLPKSGAERKKALREFFISYAVSWRQKDRVKKAKQALLIDSHAPPMLRVNLIVRQFAEFYEAFDGTESSPGYIAPEMRITFW